MLIGVRGKKCQDDGNQRNKGDVEIHERTAAKLLIGTIPVNTSFQFMTKGAFQPQCLELERLDPKTLPACRVSVPSVALPPFRASKNYQPTGVRRYFMPNVANLQQRLPSRMTNRMMSARLHGVVRALLCMSFWCLLSWVFLFPAHRSQTEARETTS